MKRLIYFLFTILLLSSCLSKHEVLQNPRAGDRSIPPSAKGRKPASTHSTKPVGTSLSGHEYIAQYKGIAIDEMNRYGIPASIKLAQALLESGNGNSMLARDANNHFGIKCTPEWPGGKAYKDDDARNDCFRVYERVEDSFRDHSQFLLRKRYAALFELNKDDYKGWAHGLKSAGYATNPRYAELLINLIDRYELHRYDRPESRIEKNRREETVHTEIFDNSKSEAQVAAAKPPVSIDIHEVKQGETLSSISKKYGVTANELRELNGLKNETVFLGQLILVSR